MDRWWDIESAAIFILCHSKMTKTEAIRRSRCTDTRSVTRFETARGDLLVSTSAWVNVADLSEEWAELLYFILRKKKFFGLSKISQISPFRFLRKNSTWRCLLTGPKRALHFLGCFLQATTGEIIQPGRLTGYLVVGRICHFPKNVDSQFVNHKLFKHFFI